MGKLGSFYGLNPLCSLLFGLHVVAEANSSVAGPLIFLVEERLASKDGLQLLIVKILKIGVFW